MLEAELARSSAPLRALRGLPWPKDIVQQVARALPRNGALVELVAYDERPLVPKPCTPESQIPHEPRYLALVLLPTGDIRTADLGPAAPIDLAAARLHESLASRDVRYVATAQELHRLAFAPLAPLLRPQRRVYISPDGQLGFVPFNVLHDGERFVADTYDVCYLTSGKDLLRRSDPALASGAVVVFADPRLLRRPAAAQPDSVRPSPGRRALQCARALLLFAARRAGPSWLDTAARYAQGGRGNPEARAESATLHGGGGHQGGAAGLGHARHPARGHTRLLSGGSQEAGGGGGAGGDAHPGPGGRDNSARPKTGSSRSAPSFGPGPGQHSTDRAFR